MNLEKGPRFMLRACFLTVKGVGVGSAEVLGRVGNSPNVTKLDDAQSRIHVEAMWPGSTGPRNSVCARDCSGGEGRTGVVLV